MKTLASLAEGSVVVGRPGFVAGRRGRQVVAAAAEVAAPLRLLVEGAEFVDGWLAALHAGGERRRAQDVSCYFECDVGVSGIGHLFVADALVISPEVMPDYWLRQMRERFDPHIDIDVGRERALPERRIDGATVVFCGWGSQVYGHFLIETMARLLVARRALGRDLLRMQFLVPAGVPDWMLRMAALLVPISAQSVRRYDPATERVRLTNAVIPTLASCNGWFHPCYGEMVDELVAGVGAAAGGARLFVTRALFAGAQSVPRRCRNEAALAEIARAEFGFSVIAPETMDWPAQVAAFAGAAVVVGEFGSGLHNALFSGAGTHVGSIGMLNLTQTMIGALRGHRNAYLRAEFGAGGDYTIDEVLFRRFLAVLVGGGSGLGL